MTPNIDEQASTYAECMSPIDRQSSSAGTKCLVNLKQTNRAFQHFIINIQHIKLQDFTEHNIFAGTGM